MTAFVVVILWIVLILLVVGVFSAARQSDRRAEDARRAREGLPPLHPDEDP